MAKVEYGWIRGGEGASGTYIWMGSALYLLFKAGKLFTWQAMAFIFIGMFVGAIIIGIGGSLLTKLLNALCAAIKINPAPVYWAGLVIEIWLGFLFTGFCFDFMF